MTSGEETEKQVSLNTLVSASSSEAQTEALIDPLTHVRKREIAAFSQVEGKTNEIENSVVKELEQDPVFGYYLRYAKRVIKPEEKVKRIKIRSGGRTVAHEAKPEGFQGGLVNSRKLRTLFEPFVSLPIRSSDFEHTLRHCTLEILHSLCDTAAESALNRGDRLVNWKDMKSALDKFNLIEEGASLTQTWSENMPPETLTVLPHLTRGFQELGNLIPARHRVLLENKSSNSSTSLITALEKPSIPVEASQQQLNAFARNHFEQEIDEELEMEYLQRLAEDEDEEIDSVLFQSQSQSQNNQRKKSAPKRVLVDLTSSSSSSSSSEEEKGSKRKRKRQSIEFEKHKHGTSESEGSV